MSEKYRPDRDMARNYSDMSEKSQDVNAEPCRSEGRDQLGHALSEWAEPADEGTQWSGERRGRRG